MRTIEIRRHGDKNGNHLSVKGIEQIATTQVVSNPQAVTDIIGGSDEIRTAETMIAVLLHQGIKPVRLHPGNPVFGDTKMIEKLVTAGFIEARKETGDNVAAAKKCLGEDGYAAMCQELANGLLAYITDNLVNDAYALAFSHSPIIEMMAEGCGCPVERELGPCEGFIFGWTFNGFGEPGTINAKLA